MNTFLFSISIHSFREARMLRMSPGNFSMPSEQPHPEAPREGDAVYNMRAEQLPEETLNMLVELSNRAHQKTDETVESEIRKIQAMAQRDVDALAATPGASKQFIIDYVNNMNATLHPCHLHIGMANGQVRISPHNPTVFPPEVIARKNRINELEGKINEVDRNIQMLMRDFRQNAVQYRNQKAVSRNPRNIAPEINKFLMQFPQGAMQASADPLNQLYAIKFQLQQELAGVKSGRIKVPVPTVAVATEDPSLIMPARFAASATGDTRFNLEGALGGIGPDGLPLQNTLPTAAEQAQILRYTERWKNAKTQEERETVEGFLMMDGVDVDGSNLENDEVVMVSPDERGMQFLIGFITVLKSFLDRLAKKKTEIESADVSQKDLSAMTSDERTTEKEGNDKKLTDFNDQKTKAESEIKEIDKQLKAVPPPEGEVKEKLETDLKNKKEEVKNIEEEIKKLEERNIVLASPAKATEDEKDRTKPETLEEDPVFQEFARKKATLKTDYQEYMRKTYMRLDNPNYTSDMDTEVQEQFSKTGKMVDWRKEHAKIWQEIIDDMDSFIENTTLEKNAAGQYRITINFSEMQYSAMGKSYQVTSNDAQKLMTKMNEGSEDKARLSIDGDKLVTPFMSGDELMKLKI